MYVLPRTGHGPVPTNPKIKFIVKSCVCRGQAMPGPDINDDIPWPPGCTQATFLLFHRNGDDLWVSVGGTVNRIDSEANDSTK